MDLLDHGERKFPDARLLGSSEGLGWCGIAVELRSHPAGDLPAFQADQLEVTLAIDGVNDAVVSRKGDGVRQETPVRAGTVWISPVGVSEDDIRITRPLPRILHLYLPPQPFADLSEATDGRIRSMRSIRYLAGVNDRLIRQIGQSVLREVAVQTSGGRILAESLAATLTTHLAHVHSTAPSPVSSSLQRQLDDARLHRVIDFIMEHMDEDLGLADLASAACLSPFHFARMFRSRMGVPPHRYLGQLRLESAKAMLLKDHQPVVEIAEACRFSNQANFTRAFRQFTGMTPGQYRSARGRPDLRRTLSDLI